MIPIIVPVVAAGAALAGLVYYLVKGASPAATAAALNDLADRVAVTMPRGERAFKPDIAAGIVGAFASRFYHWPDPNERRVVQLDPNTKGAPISIDISAMGWAQSLNKSQSILAMLTMATTTPGTQLLRAVAPGTEKDYAGPGGMYAVLLYAGTLDKQLAPPGAPPPQVVPNAPIPADVLGVAMTAIQAADPSGKLADEFMALIQEGTDPDAMDTFVVELLKNNLQGPAALLHRRANDLRQQLGVPAQPMPGAATPPAVPLPGVTPPPTPQAPVTPYVPPAAPPGGAIPGLPPPNVVPAGSAIVATQTDPLSLRSAPSSTANVVGSLPKGATVQITGGIVNGFYPVTYGSLSGYAYGGYLRPSGAPSVPVGPTPATNPNLPPPNVVPVGTATVTTASDPLSLRANPSTTAPVVGSLPRGATVQITGPIQNGFYPVAYGAAHGFAYGGYLTPSGAQPSVPTPQPVSPVSPLGEASNTLTVVNAPSGLNLRASPVSGAPLRLIPNGSTVTLLNPDTSSGWANIAYAGQSGYSSMQYLQ